METHEAWLQQIAEDSSTTVVSQLDSSLWRSLYDPQLDQAQQWVTDQPPRQNPLGHNLPSLLLYTWVGWSQDPTLSVG